MTAAAAPRKEDDPVRYLILIYEQGSANPPAVPPPQAEIDATRDAYRAYGTMLRDRNAMLGGEALQPVTAATTVRVRDGQTLTTDGPFAETKEALGGFYLVEAKDLDEALEYAAACPGAKYGSIEVRPIWEFM